MSEQSSNTSPTPSAFYDPESSCWRTSQASLLSEAPESLDRLPPWGTTSDGALFELRTPALLIDVRAGFALLATPTAWLGSCPSRAIGDPERWNNPERSNELSDQMAALLPTPTAWEQRETPEQYRGNLEEQIALLPTPVVNDMGAGKTVEDWDTWTDEMKAKHGNGNGHGPSLSIEAQRLLPTPTVNDSHNHNSPPSQFNRSSLALPALMKVLPSPQHWDHKVFGPNVDWKKRAESHADSVASVLMNLPLNDGDESSDDPPPTQQMIEGCDPDSSNG